MIRAFLRKIYDCIFPIQIKGEQNKVSIPKQLRHNVKVFVYGNGNEVIISDKCRIFNKLIITLHGDGNSFRMAEDSKFVDGKISLRNGAKLNIQRNSTFQETTFDISNSSCDIGVDCMFSYGVIVRNSDGHKIVKLGSDVIINEPKPIIIDEHVWVGQNVAILKNTHIKHGSIIGLGAVVSGEIPENSIAVGVPAKVVKQNYSWIRH